MTRSGESDLGGDGDFPRGLNVHRAGDTATGREDDVLADELEIAGNGRVQRQRLRGDDSGPADGAIQRDALARHAGVAADGGGAGEDHAVARGSDVGAHRRTDVDGVSRRVGVASDRSCRADVEARDVPVAGHRGHYGNVVAGDEGIARDLLVDAGLLAGRILVAAEAQIGFLGERGDRRHKQGAGDDYRSPCPHDDLLGLRMRVGSRHRHAVDLIKAKCSRLSWINARRAVRLLDVLA